MKTPHSTGMTAIEQGDLNPSDSDAGSAKDTSEEVTQAEDIVLPVLDIHGAPITPRDKNKYFIKTYGCQMNVADSERMASLLSEKGMKPARGVEEAGLILINGCTVREKAVHKAVSTLGRYYHQLKDQGMTGPGDKPIIGIGGCVGQLEKEALFKQAPYLDFVFGTDTIDHLPEIVYRVEQGEKHIVFADFDRTQSYTTETKVLGLKAQAFVNIMKGCDKFCTYCIVPFTRGREKSRTIEEVLNDLARMSASGVREITLLGQNVNSFGKGNPNTANRAPVDLKNQIGKVGPRAGDENFPQLLHAIDADPRLGNIRRIRFTSSHPLDFSDELIDAYSTVKKLAPQLHLPVQSGSNRVLQKMGRHHKIEGYIAQMDLLRAQNPLVGLSTDLIVGFPGETEEDFQATLTLLDRVQYDNIFAFAYSPRPGTRAAKLDDDVSVKEKNDRLNRLLQHQLKISEARSQLLVGSEMEILVEGESKKQTLVEKGEGKGRVWTGRTGCMRIVHFADDSGRNLVGRFLRVKILAATALSMKAELIHDAMEAERYDVLPTTASGAPVKYGALQGSAMPVSEVIA
ncbi:MAG: tRNA (N6-isopentenyl adenosine(37)-C2)-methylthiotransferase MiaB [Cryobacterium sp.]|nr:tRNA (N6-isopentenyl adenosine(37)-C2)-methylthiotransferase MiaB [Oligoflexia bacterium]